MEKRWLPIAGALVVGIAIGYAAHRPSNTGELSRLEEPPVLSRLDNGPPPETPNGNANPK